MTLALQTKKEILASQIALKRRLNNEERLYRELSVFFRKLKKEVLSALDEYWSDYQMLQGHINLICAPVHEAHREYYEILGKHALQEYKLGKEEGTRLVKRANTQTALKATKDLPIDGFITKNSDELFGTLPKAEQDLLNRIYKTSEQTLSRVDGQLNQIITEGYVKGKGIDSVANDLTKRFNQLSTWEAKRIARTEMNTSHNMATMDAYQKLGVEYTQWIAASDGKTRDSHVEVDGEIIPFGGTYSNNLRYPGDMSGPIEEWINCRCSNAPFVIPFGYMAPSFSPFRESDLVQVEGLPTVEELLTPQQIMEKTPTSVEQLASSNNKLLQGDYKVYTEIDDHFGGVKSELTVYKYQNIELAFDKNAKLTHEEVVAHINSLPKIFEKTHAKRIVINDHSFQNEAGHFSMMNHYVRIFKTNKSKSEYLDTLTHELAHSIDISKPGTPYAYSLVEKWEKIFKADNQLYAVVNERTGRKRIPKKFPTKYAGQSWLKFKKKKESKKKIFVEDFAESSRLYLNPTTHDNFVKDFPNRAKYLEEIYGKPKFDKNSPLYKALKEEGLI